METVDTLIIVFAVIAVVGSAAGAFLYDAPATPQTFVVSFAKEERDVAAPSETLTPPGSSTLDLPIGFDNLTGLTLDVTVDPSGTAPRLQALTASIALKRPDGSSAGAAQTLTWTTTDSSAKTARFSVAQAMLSAMPEPFETDNLTLEEARAHAAAQHTNSTLRGDWKIDVTINPQTGSTAPGETFAVAASGTAERYHAVVQLKTPDVGGAAQ